MGERVETLVYKEYDCKPDSNITTTNASAKKTDQGEQRDDKTYINNNNKVTSCINSNKNDDIGSPFRIYHQNIRGIKGEIDEFMIHLLREKPDIICLTEHHLRDFEMDVTCIPTYKVGAKFC
jgi:hypothetical protein